jgi:hypothetical protein
LCFRKVVFDLIVDGEPFISELDTLEKAVASFFHLCFVANIVYPVGSGMLCCFLQCCVAKLDELGTTATFAKKDQVAKEDKASRPFKKTFAEFARKMYVIVSNREKN